MRMIAQSKMSLPSSEIAFKILILVSFAISLTVSLLSPSTTLLVLFTAIIWSVGRKRQTIANQYLILIPSLLILGLYFLSLLGEKFSFNLQQIWLSVLIAMSTLGLVRCFTPNGSFQYSLNTKPRNLFLTLASFSGALIWSSYYVGTRIFQTNSSISWVMSGDTATFLADTGEYIRPGGLGIIGAPVPIPSLLIGLFSSGASFWTTEESSLSARVAGLSDSWAICIIFMSILVTLVSTATLKQAKTSPLLIALISGVVSLFPLTWIYTGYAINYGFFSSTIVLCLLLMAFLLYLNFSGNLPFQLFQYLVLSCAIFLVWIPFAVFPVGLLLVNLNKENIKSFFKANGAIRNSLFAVLVSILFTITVVLPYIFSILGTSALGSGMLVLNGAAIYFRPIVLLSAVVSALIFGFWATGLKSSFSKGIISSVLVFLLSFIYMVIASGKSDFPWMYYPSKYAWIALLFLLPLIFTSVAAVVFRLLPQIKWIQVLSGFLMIIVVFYFFKILSTKGHINIGSETSDIFHLVSKGPEVPQIDRVPSNEVAQKIFNNVGKDDLFLFWGSGDPNEGIIDFWVLKNWNSSEHGNYFIGDITYGLRPHDSTVLCELGATISQKINVITSDVKMVKDVGVQCPEISFSFMEYQGAKFD